MGESNIYNLIDPEKFDGLIAVPDTIKFPGVIRKVTADFKRLGLPIVTIDLQIGEYPCVWCNDADDIESLVDHLIDDHGCRIIDFFKRKMLLYRRR